MPAWAQPRTPNEQHRNYPQHPNQASTAHISLKIWVCCESVPHTDVCDSISRWQVFIDFFKALRQSSPLEPLTLQHIYRGTESPCHLPKLSIWQHLWTENQSHQILTDSVCTLSLVLSSLYSCALYDLHNFTQQQEMTHKLNTEKQHTLAICRSHAHMGSWLARVSWERVSHSCAPQLLKPGHVSYRPLEKQQLSVDPSSLP